MDNGDSHSEPAVAANGLGRFWDGSYERLDEYLDHLSDQERQHGDDKQWSGNNDHDADRRGS